MPLGDTCSAVYPKKKQQSDCRRENRLGLDSTPLGRPLILQRISYPVESLALQGRVDYVPQKCSDIYWINDGNIRPTILIGKTVPGL